MIYLKLYESFENDILDLLKNNKDWKENKNIPDHIKFEYKYKLKNNIDVCITGLILSHFDRISTCCYIYANDEYFYVDYIENGKFAYIKSHHYACRDNILKSAIEICKGCLPYFTDRVKLPSDEELIQKYFVSFEEEIGFEFRDIKWGFVYTNFLKQDESNRMESIVYKEPEVYFPHADNSKTYPHLIILLDNKNISENKLATREEISEEFKSCAGKMSTEYDNINCKLYFTDSDYRTIDNKPDWYIRSFMIVIEYK